MELKFLLVSLVISGVLLLVVGVTGQVVLGKRPPKPPPVVPAEINSVYANFQTYLLHVEGSSFDAGSTPVVYLGGFGLPVLSYSSQQLVVMPKGNSWACRVVQTCCGREGERGKAV